MKGIIPLALIVLVTLGSVSGCQQKSEFLELDDLTPGERLYIERFMILERAQAVALVDVDSGTAILDSLAAAWGDSSLAMILDGLPADPLRSAAVQDLLLRIMDAESDSLVNAPYPYRLTAPLPEPSPAETAQ